MILLVLIFGSCGAAGGGSADKRIVMKIDGKNVSVDEYGYFYYNCKRDAQNAAPAGSKWTNENEIKLKKTVLDIILKNYAVYSLAKKYGVALDSGDKKSINEEIKSTIEYFGGKAAYYDKLSANHLTGDGYRNILELNALEDKLRGYLLDEGTTDIRADDKTVESDFSKNFIRVTHILIRNNNGKTDAENLQTALSLKSRADAGEDFIGLVKEFGEDVELNIDTGYYITRGEFHKPFEDAAFALDVNGISGVVKTEVGYHVIKRLPLDLQYLDDYFEIIRDTYMTRTINERIEETAKTLTIEYSGLYATLFNIGSE